MKKTFFTSTLLLLCTQLFFALAVPTWNGPVNDQASILSSSQKTELQQYLTAVNDQSGVQIALLTLPSLEGDSLEDFSMRVVDAWKLGQKDEDNGALLLVVLDERAVRIEVGYGLEQSLTDMKSGLIIRNVIIPYFSKGDYAAGIKQGLINMVGLATNNMNIVIESVKNADSSKENDIGGILVSIITIIIFLIIMGGGIFRRGRFFLGPHIGGGMFHTHNHSSGGGFTGGGGFGGGGGFSGGGGGFGGGGASGRW